MSSEEEHQIDSAGVGRAIWQDVVGGESSESEYDSDGDWMPEGRYENEDSEMDEDEEDQGLYFLYRADHSDDEEPNDSNGEPMHHVRRLPNPEEMLPAHVLASIRRIFTGASANEQLIPMLFIKSSHERKQEELMPQQRIAQQLQGYNMDSGAALLLHGRYRHNQRLHTSLLQREQLGRSTKAQAIQMHEAFMPFQENKHCRVVDEHDDRLYCGGFNSTGSRFLTAGQRDDITLYDSTTWESVAELPVNDIRWTVTDAKFTPDDSKVLYSTINSTLRMVDAREDEEPANEVAFDLSMGDRVQVGHGRHMHRANFGIWSFGMNYSGTELIAGTTRNSVVLYDLEKRTVLCHAEGHNDDVNAIAFVDGPLHSNVFVSGSDDGLIKMWDRRVISTADPRPQGVFPGHTDGLTYISARDDGHYFISNSKDQSCRLWDIRKCMSAEKHAELPSFRKPYLWDYRFEPYPGLMDAPTPHPNDVSVMTYRGHMVMETLIRCHFSPLHTTAQKYVYTGSADGRVYFFDTVTGELVEAFSMRTRGVTRDVRWHPYDPTVVSPDFYGKLCVWAKKGTTL